ncbi:MAG: hypothetical protein JXB50_09540 [Spirochaetes bacterium]|nr:hypothetical protein [Spirochaetota bacterium]
MNKKLNTFIFMLIATLLNVFLIIIFIILAFLILSVASKYLSSEFMFFVTISTFLTAIIASFLVYHKIILFVSKKYNLNDKIDPIFKSKNKNIDKK